MNKIDTKNKFAQKAQYGFYMAGGNIYHWSLGN